MSPACLLRALMAVALVAPAAAAPAASQTLDKVTFGTDRLAGAEQGGFFQAVADGTYKSYGLDVTIVPGGPNVNNGILLAAGKLDFDIGANTLKSFETVSSNMPLVTVAAVFQKDPQAILAHPNPKLTRLEDLKPLTIFIAREGATSYFQWMKSAFGFSKSKVKPATVNAQPFIADRNSAMQGCVTSELYVIGKQAGFTPLVMLLADNGFDGYSTLIETRRELVDTKPDLVQRFVDASMIGWYTYLYGDNRPANDMIRKLNPDMTDDALAYAKASMKTYGIVDSGDTLRDGIGAMTDARIASFFDKMSRAGVVGHDLDYRRAYTLQFVNKGVGLNLRPRK